MTCIHCNYESMSTMDENFTHCPKCKKTYGKEENNNLVQETAWYTEVNQRNFLTPIIEKLKLLNLSKPTAASLSILFLFTVIITKSLLPALILLAVIFSTILLIDLVKKRLKPEDNCQDQIICKHCDGIMTKTAFKSGSYVNSLIAVIVFLSGILIFFVFLLTIIGPIIGILMMIMSFGMGRKWQKIWKCQNCSSYIARL